MSRRPYPRSPAAPPHSPPSPPPRSPSPPCGERRRPAPRWSSVQSGPPGRAQQAAGGAQSGPSRPRLHDRSPSLRGLLSASAGENLPRPHMSKSRQWMLPGAPPQLGRLAAECAPGWAVMERGPGTHTGWPVLGSRRRSGRHRLWAD